ncbi:beta strand repeat-containing protein [Lactococcus allomyrinae]|uniref:Prealbumin-like fold domain-containing protein n=1 Tax=Lactococcus allomyrinae TaxID=2419773 RepID=A0A387B8F3_9LACT|nr:hypothetical protein [Lactococcus allomyrinae]AYF99972.1 hypothetical protein D7I46_02035 [Lactococcus allomyrinae]
MKLPTVKSLNRNVALSCVTLLTITTLGGALLTTTAAFAASTGEIIINAQSAAPQMTNDGTQTGNANIGQTSGAGGQGNTSGTTNDGSDQSTLDANSTMANVTFSATPITPDTASGKTAANMVAPTLASDGTTSTTGAGYVTNNSVNSGNPYNATTNSNGVATLSSLPNGYYLVQQETKVGGVYEIQPFIVNVDGNTGSTTNPTSPGAVTNVYPKLDLTTTMNTQNTAVTDAKDAVTNTLNNNTATLNDLSPATSAKTGALNTPTLNQSDLTDLNTSDTGNTTTAAGGNQVSFNLNTSFDSSQVTNAATGSTTSISYTDSSGNNYITGNYGITDILPTDSSTKQQLATLNNNLTGDVTSDITIPSIVITTGDDAGKDLLLSLTPNVDYKATSTDGKTITITLTSQGQVDIANQIAIATGTPVGQISGTLNIQVATTVPTTAVGSAMNLVTTNVTNAFGTTLTTGSAGNTTASSTLNVGGLDIEKVDTDNSPIKNVANGATFVLINAASWADAQKLVKDNAASFDNTIPTKQITDGTASLVLGNSSGAVDASGATTTPVFSVSSTTDGTLSFTGLDLSGAGNSSKTTQGNSNMGVGGNYYAVEVKAPTGYQLPNPSTGANVFGPTNSMNVSTNPTQNLIQNSKPFALPFTGGKGIIGVIILAGALTVGGVMIRKRHGDKVSEL